MRQGRGTGGEERLKMQQIASVLTGKRGGGGGGRVVEIEETQELPGVSRTKIPRKLPTFGSGAC